MLAHVVRNKVEAAYARSDLFERRRLLMSDWGGAPRRQKAGDAPLTAGAEVPVDVARGYPARLDGVDRRLRAPRR